MASSGYTAVSFVADQLLTSTVMNQMAGNDAAFNNGNGFEDDIIISRHIADNAVLAAHRSQVAKVVVVPGSTLGSTGNKALTGVGFRPKAAIALMLANDVLNTSSSITTTGFADATTQRMTCTYVGGSNTVKQHFTDAFIGFITNSGAQQKASLVSFDSDGATINVTTANAVFDALIIFIA